MTVYSFPTLSTGLTDFYLGQRSNVFVHASAPSGTVQTVEMPGARWTISLTLDRLPLADARKMTAFLTKMRGQANRFTCHDISKPAPSGTMRGTLTVLNSVSQGAIACDLTGGPGQASKTLLEGDFIKIGDELKCIAANAVSDSLGNISVTFEPPLRKNFNSGTPVVWDKPTATFMLTRNDWQAHSHAQVHTSYSIDAVEDFA